MTDQPRPFHEIADDAMQAAEEYASAKTPEAKAAAQAKADRLLSEAEALHRVDTESGSRALDFVKRSRRQAGIPTTTDPEPPPRGRVPDEKTPAKEPQTKSGAEGAKKIASGDHGFVRPHVDGGIIGQTSGELLEIQKRLCEILGREPKGLDDRRGTRATTEDIDWEGDYSRAIADLAAKEQELAYWAGVVEGGFGEGDADALGKIRDHFRSAADDLAKSDTYRAKAEEMRKQVDDYAKTYEAVRSNLVDDGAEKTVKTGAGKAKKGADQAIKGGEKAQRWAKKSADLDKTIGDAKKAAAVKKIDAKAPGVTKAMSQVGKLSPMGQASGMMGAGFLRMGHFASQLRQLELDKVGSSVASSALAHQRAAEQALGELLDDKIGIGIEALNRRLARENPGATPPTFTLHRHGDTKWDERIAKDISRFYEKRLGTMDDDRYLPSTHLGLNQIRRGVEFDRAAFEKWCRNKGHVAMGVPNKTPLAVVAIVVAILAAIGGGVLFTGDDVAVDDPEIVIGDDPILDDSPVDEPADDTPADDTPAIGPPMFLTPLDGCPDVTHSPAPGSLDPSFIRYTILLATEQGLAPDGSRVDLLFSDGDDPTSVETTGGVGSAVFPISSFGDYSLMTVGAPSVPGSDDVVLIEPLADDFTVGPDEGPIGCIDPSTLTDDEKAAKAAGAGDRFPSLDAITDEPDAIPPPEDDLAPFREFLTRFDAAHGAGDVDALLDALDPATIDRYGADQCRTYLEGTAGTIGELFLVDGAPEPWDYPTDGRTTEVPDAWTITMEATTAPDGARTTFEFHLRPGPGGVTWFSDCGEPL